MRERVGALVGRSVRAMWVTTFHSACARMLRADAERLGYSRGFTIYDESDSLRMLKRCMDELHVDPKRYPPRAIRSQISGAKNQLVDAAAYAEAQGSVFEETAAEAYALYEKRMLEANAMDFDDLLVRTVNALELFEEVRERWRRTFRHVLVDEYQDTNHAQYRLLQLLTSEHGNLMVVGDEDQSIYGFRHADIRNILDFERDFPEAEVVKLEQNYRSTQTILSAANAVVERNRERRPKRLWTEIAGGEPLQLSELTDEHEEARWVAGEIERLGEEEGVRREDVAVFYRTNAMSRVLEDTLVRFELPYQVIGGTKFYERAEIKDAVAYLSLLVNPSDQVSFARIVNSPRRGIGNTSQGRLAAHANTTGTADLGGRRAGRGGAGPGRGGDQGGLPLPRDDGGAAGAGRRGARSPSCSRRSCSETGYLEALAAERTIEAEGRVENLEELVGVAAEFDANRELEGEGEVPPLEEFLQQISLYTEQDGLRRRVADHADDPAQRQGAGVRHGLHRRLRGRRLPAHAGAGRGGRGGGAAPLLRRHHPRPPAPLHDLGARTAPVRTRRAQPALALRRRAAGRADRAPLQRAGRRDRLGTPRRPPARVEPRSTPARRWSCAPATTSSTPASATASSPRSSRAGWSSSASPATATERKLMADYAPIRRR